MPLFLLPLLGKVAEKLLPASINAVVQLWLQDKINKNTQDMKDNVEAKRIRDDADHMADLEKRAAAGDAQAQQEIRNREAE